MNGAVRLMLTLWLDAEATPIASLAGSGLVTVLGQLRDLPLISFPGYA